MARRLIAVYREALTARHYARRTIGTYERWLRRYLRFHRLRHPREMGGPATAITKGTAPGSCSRPWAIKTGAAEGACNTGSDERLFAVYKVRGSRFSARVDRINQLLCFLDQSLIIVIRLCQTFQAGLRLI